MKILKISKIWKFQKSNRFLLKIEIFNKKSQKWPPHKNLKSDGNRNYIITWCSYSAKIKLQYMKNTFHVAHFHIKMVLSTRNMFKQVHVIKSRGALGTGFTYCTSIWQSCGKPSTKFPHGGLVECLSSHNFLSSLLKIQNFIFSIFSEILIFQNFWKSGTHQSGAGITFYILSHHIDLQYTLDKVFCAFS